MDIGALNIFYLHKTYFCSHINTCSCIYDKFHPGIAKLLPRVVRVAQWWDPGWGHCSEVSLIKIYKDNPWLFNSKTEVSRSRN